ncbi:hypothetical protein SDJN02_09994, partial [Cucurbita argyrosperma subsp. argyrosperma]
MSFHCHSRGLLSAGPSRKRKEPSALKAGEQPITSNRLLAGYMAYEFLTKGTILGRKFDPDRAEASPFPNAVAQYKKPKTEAAPPEIIKKEHQIQSYADVATILKTDKAQISGIVNPTQLARWLTK